MNPQQSWLLWLLPLFPAIGAVINAIFGKRLQDTVGKKAVHGVAILMPALSAVVAWVIFFQLLGMEPENRALSWVGWDWIVVGFVDARFAFWVDPLTSMMLLIITTIGTLIHIYSTGYMADEESYWRFFCYLNLFVTMMLILVLGDSFLMMFVGWEGVGVCSYLLVLGVGVLGISTRRSWHLLNFLSFVCTYVVFFHELNVGNYDPKSAVQFWQVMPFLSAYFVLFSTMVFLFNVVHRRKSTVLELLALVVNAGIFFVSSYVMIDSAYGKSWVALVTVMLAVFYTAHVQYFLLRGLQDRGLLLSFIALAAFFVAVTIPIRISPEWLTVSWSIRR